MRPLFTRTQLAWLTVVCSIYALIMQESCTYRVCKAVYLRYFEFYQRFHIFLLLVLVHSEVRTANHALEFLSIPSLLYLLWAIFKLFKD
ncbi:hypothetical protein M501DRAFT_595967 [Patellaria atrata CBS 101060]|uniref:Uncharacterized protein n=1 Tax=Patellaria atrata CBS 101060 TaxID=1346257 RepID=A0A9P4S3I0_9PEZI|nr:hypothetical protein M501DRAFT_595967 [Patellaria atrata CBS 101060]